MDLLGGQTDYPVVQCQGANPGGLKDPGHDMNFFT
jgi:hypothetical protein